MFAWDGTAWLHPAAKALADRQYVYCPTSAVHGKSIVVGHPHFILAWVHEQHHSSWALPISTWRIPSQQTDVDIGVVQVRQLCHHRRAEMAEWLHLIVADGKYGNHRFLGPLKDEPCGILVRLRCDRVLYGAPGPYSGQGRPRVHGHRFAFKDTDTWPEPDAEVEMKDERRGKVRLRRWDDLHARQDAATPFSVILIETHLEREKPSKPLFLAYQPPPHQAPDDQRVVDLWRWYDQRWPVEPSIRFRKQYLYWTLPRFQTLGRCDRWTMLVNIAQWQLFLARDVVKDHPLPWQPTQEHLTPERVRQGLGGLFRQIDTPAVAPKTRGKPVGWPKGRARTCPQRHQVVKKTKKRAKAA